MSVVGEQRLDHEDFATADVLDGSRLVLAVLEIAFLQIIQGGSEPGSDAFAKVSGVLQSK